MTFWSSRGPVALAAMAALAASLALAPLAAAQQDKAAPALPAGTDHVVATVNGLTLRLSDLVAAKRRLPEQYRDMPLRAIYPALLSQVVERALMYQAAERDKLAEDARVVTELARLRRRLLGDAWLQLRIQAAMTEERLRALHAREAKAKKGPLEVRARHILVKTEDEALEIVKQLKRGGDFATLAKERSTGPSGAKGGDLGFFARGAMVPEFDEVAFELADGEVSAPVRTRFGWHVIEVVERRQSGGASFEDSQRELRAKLTLEVIREVTAELRQGAKIKLFDREGKELAPAETKRQ